MFLLLAGRNEADEVFTRMAAALRGGAGEPRLWRDEHRNAAAASMRVDFTPEDAFDAQPVIEDDFVLVAQVRIDNRDELLEQLALDSRMADATLLAKAYARWGEECVQKLVGDFAFAVWHRDGRVFAAVDPTGIRRLMWTRIGNAIALSPQISALLAHPDVSREPDLAAVATLMNAGIDRTSTPFASIRALPGGHCLRNGRVERWWSPDTTAKIWYRDPRDYAHETRELFTRAVIATLRSTTPVSTTLSGGLDSGAVTAFAARTLSRLTAYTAVPEENLAPTQRRNWEPDDREYAAAVVAACGNIDHRLVTPGGRCILDVLPQIHERTRVTAKNVTNLVWFERIANLTIDAGSRVLLIGQAGNGAFSWRGENAVWELARSGRVGAAVRQASIEARSESTARVLARSMRDGIRTAMRTTPSIEQVNPPARQFLKPEHRPRTAANEYAEVAGSRAAWLKFVTTPQHTWSPDPTAMWGLELRDPTADRRLLERLLRYPQAAFRLGGRDRGLAREVTAGVLPERVRLRNTFGAQVPEAPSLIAAHAEHYRAVLTKMRATPSCRELFAFDALESALAAFVAGESDYYLALGFDRAFAAGLFLAGLERDA